MEAKAMLMIECGEIYQVDDTEGERYQVKIQPCDFLLVSMGFTHDKAAANFTHSNIIASRKVVHHFKHYCRNGRKFWTSRAGVDHYMVVPKNKIMMLPEKGYSYVPVEINGVKVKFNVTGGTMDGWTDYIGQSVQTSVNHKLADLKKVLEVAVRGTGLEPLTFKSEGDEIQEWEKIVGEKTAKKRLIDMIEKGGNPVLKLKPRYSYMHKDEGKAVELIRAGRWNRNGKPGEPCFNCTGAPKSVIMDFFGDGHHSAKCRAKIGQIDWAASVKMLEAEI